MVVVFRSSSTSSVDKGRTSSSRSIKKSFYSKLKKEEEEREAEWADKYRDRVGGAYHTGLYSDFNL